MKILFRPLSAAILLAALMGPLRVFAATEAEAAAGRSLVKRYADAIVTIELVVVVKTGGERGSQSREVKREANGTVISANGLTVTSLALIDPRAGSAARGGGDAPETEFKEVKLLLTDNTEVPASVVLKDGDLDLAFVAPDPDAAGKREFSYVKLDEPAEAGVLDTYFDVTRVSKALQRTPVVQLSTLVGIVEKPRRLFLASEQSIGGPLFDAQGRLLGISLVYSAGGRQVGAVILPAADVADIAKQAAAVKPQPPEKPADGDVKPPADEPKAP
jgi:S1-C subfamily serine protease